MALAVGLGDGQSGANIRLRQLEPSLSVKLTHADYETIKVTD